ncbi:hypothetical protein BB561_004211 [Smittium simulii]|uniref:Grh/CP2 DB domain-containing protein n=1 Tax=Smittium simulii TaxID=133385 RepID=A0A2T9YHI1_9FUNG|nr:hypothetical protein BB561_004211 [Smittium simulii]
MNTEKYPDINSEDMLSTCIDVSQQYNKQNRLLIPPAAKYYKSDNDTNSDQINPTIIPNECFNSFIGTQLYNNHISANYNPKNEYNGGYGYGVSANSYQNVLQLPPYRFSLFLDAPTSISQKMEEFTTTYINRGQKYMISINDSLQSDEKFQLTAILTFHDQIQRQRAVSNWQFWMLQQQDLQSAKAFEIDTTKSSGIVGAPYNVKVDRLSVNVNLSKDPKLCLKFNVLSTDFSKTKGIKGISLGIIIEIKNLSKKKDANEYYYSQIKIFRDKGAERKNKDNQKKLEKVIQKIHSGTDNSYYAKRYLDQFREPSKYTIMVPLKMDEETFRLIDTCDVSENNLQIYPPLLNNTSIIQPGNLGAVYKTNNFANKSPYKENKTLDSRVVTVYDKDKIPTQIVVEGIDSSCVIKDKKGPAALCIFVMYPNSDKYRAIYLYQLTVTCLLEAIFPFLPNSSKNYIYDDIYRVTKNGHYVAFNDEIVKNMKSEQDIILDIEKIENIEKWVIKLIY